VPRGEAEGEVVYANWTAEEHGIVGSTEWVEANEERLRRGGVAYLHLDMAAMGPRFSASASPLLRRVVEEAVRLVPACLRRIQESLLSIEATLPG